MDQCLNRDTPDCRHTITSPGDSCSNAGTTSIASIRSLATFFCDSSLWLVSNKTFVSSDRMSNSRTESFSSPTKNRKSVGLLQTTTGALLNRANLTNRPMPGSHNRTVLSSLAERSCSAVLSLGFSLLCNQVTEPVWLSRLRTSVPSCLFHIRMVWSIPAETAC